MLRQDFDRTSTGLRQAQSDNHIEVVVENVIPSLSDVTLSLSNVTLSLSDVTLSLSDVTLSLSKG